MITESSNNDLFKTKIVLPMFLQFHKNTIFSEIDSFREYIIDSRNNIKKQQNIFNEMIETEKKKYPENIDGLLEHYEEQYYQINKFYPATFNNSTLLSLYSLFEFNLKSLCITVQDCEEMKIKLDDINGEGYISKSKKYLNLVVGLDLNELEQTWEKITFFQRLRNCIVHFNSNIKKKKNQVVKNLDIYKEIENNPYLKIDDRGTFIISDDKFLLDILDLINIYLKTIIKKLEVRNQ